MKFFIDLTFDRITVKDPNLLDHPNDDIPDPTDENDTPDYSKKSNLEEEDDNVILKIVIVGSFFFH